MKFYLPILLAIAGTTTYHIAQKSVDPRLDPRVALAVAYGASLAVCLISLGFRPPSRPEGSVTSWSWAPIAIGISIVAVEAGFLLAYRAGWKVSLASAVANVLTASLLLVIGLTVYGERLALPKAAGLLLCLVGLALILK